MNEDKAARYHRLGRRASVLSTVLTLGLLAALILSGGSGALRSWSENAGTRFGAGLAPSATVALYVLALSIFIDLLLLPVSFYQGFLLERRYGLGTQTISAWVNDYAKAFGLGLVLAECGATFVYLTLRRWPDTWWLISSFGYSIATIALAALAPIFLLPLFFKLEPLANTVLRDRLTALAARARTSVMGVYQWTLSDRTRKANAALAGLGGTRRIILSDTLLADYSDDEIEVILAHELAHHVHRDIWSHLMFDAVMTFAAAFVAHRALQAMVRPLALRGASDPAGIPVMLIAAGVLAILARPAMNALSRAHERRADAFALQLTENPSAFMSAMRRLGQQNLAEENPSRVVQAFFYTHPPIDERLRAARNWAAAS